MGFLDGVSLPKQLFRFVIFALGLQVLGEIAHDLQRNSMLRSHRAAACIQNLLGRIFRLGAVEFEASVELFAPLAVGVAAADKRPVFEVGRT